MTVSQDFILQNLTNVIEKTDFPLGKKIYQGKVRDTYEINGKRVLITTDRQSAFDRILASIPFKGQVLNRISAFWFGKTKDIIENHLIAVPDANVSVVKKATVLPIEMVVRGYITGTTSTSAWVNYNKGVRDFCGVRLPEGLKKNQKFEHPIITPTTKTEAHDEKISPKEIVERGIMTEDDWDFVADKALRLFQRGSEISAKNGFILVDTKYEFGKDSEGNIILIDEIHTPDSSRYWKVSTYEERFSKGEEPETFDKEFLRLWFVEHCDPYNDKVLPDAPQDLVVKLSEKYMQAFETITGEEFVPEMGGVTRIEENLKKYFEE
ncbi:phosphoribosylaminoimidazolesuccinocarboxamide synthase [Candidatus Peregrinibacteria bacterium]|nr:phosphoribosylaminoimidazolesuccinocarboxamide synthase [Candidatus Peregrinibacteria bacterium]